MNLCTPSPVAKSPKKTFLRGFLLGSMYDYHRGVTTQCAGIFDLLDIQYCISSMNQLDLLMCRRDPTRFAMVLKSSDPARRDVRILGRDGRSLKPVRGIGTHMPTSFPRVSANEKRMWLFGRGLSIYQMH